MYLTTVDRLCVKLFLVPNVLPYLGFLRMGFIVVQWENETSMSVVNEKKVAGAVELKEGTTVGKISVQPHPTLCIQFLNRENNDKNNTFPLGKQICFTMVWGCAETLPNS